MKGTAGKLLKNLGNLLEGCISSTMIKNNCTKKVKLFRKSLFFTKNLLWPVIINEQCYPPIKIKQRN
jgi:hypothetical protein